MSIRYLGACAVVLLFTVTSLVSCTKRTETGSVDAKRTELAAICDGATKAFSNLTGEVFFSCVNACLRTTMTEIKAGKKSDSVRQRLKTGCATACRATNIAKQMNELKSLFAKNYECKFQYSAPISEAGPSEFATK